MSSIKLIYVVGVCYVGKFGHNDFFTAYFKTNDEVNKFVNSFVGKVDAYVQYVKTVSEYELFESLHKN